MGDHVIEWRSFMTLVSGGLLLLIALTKIAVNLGNG